MNLRKNGLLDFTVEDLFENILYYVPNSSVARPDILDENQTVDLLCKTKKSICRFGDGEISIINGHDIPFQKYDEKLAQRMRDILKNNNDNLMVGINYWYFYPVYNMQGDEISRRFAFYSMPRFRKKLIPLISFSKTYCDAGFTGIRGEKNSKNNAFFKKIRTLWNNQPVVLVGCREAYNNIKFDLFDNALKKDWVFVPNMNAFSEYDDILEQIKKYDKKALVILMAGPTSKVLVYDLAELGYRALDLGHLAKSYDHYCRQVVWNSEQVEKFYAPDV